MKTTVNEYDFRDAFKRYDRDNFSYAGLGALFEYLEEYEEQCNDELELDVIALCCDLSEHASALACLDDMGYGFEPEGDDDDEREESALEYLRENTSVIEFNGGIIIQGF